MPLTYRGIDMSIVHARQIAREAVFSEDRTTYLYTRWTFDVDCVWNPADVSWAAGAPAFGSSPTITDTQIRHLLLQPRGTLVFTVGSGVAAETLLRCPDPPATVDLENGPHVEACTVQAIHGSKTFAISLRIRCAVNECSYPGQPVILLSHRWRRHAEMDQDYFTTIVTEGEAVFRADELVRLGRFPAEYRADLLHAVPTNFKRESTSIIPSEDGTRLRYRTVDRELPYSLGGSNPANRVECYVTNGYSEPSMLSAVTEGIAGLIESAPDMVGGGGAGSMGSVPGALFRTATSTARRMVPTYHQHILCRVWGHKNSRKRDLLAVGMAIVLRQTLTFMRNSEISITFDVPGRFVEISTNRRTGMEALTTRITAPWLLAGAGAGTFAEAFAASEAALRAGFPAGDYSALGSFGVGVGMAIYGHGGVAAGSLWTDATHPELGVAVHAAMPTPVPPGRAAPVAGYGTFIGTIASQALSEPCTIPPRPREPNTPDRTFSLY